MSAAPLGKEISIFLMDGTLSGPRQASLTNWNALVTSVPRASLLAEDLLEDLRGQPGVCLLMGQDMTGDPFVHVCCSSDALGLLLQDFDFEHRGMYWSEAAVITASPGVLEGRRLAWLTARFADLARSAGHAVSVTSTEAAEAGLPRRIRDTLEAFVQNACTVLPVLGCRVLETSPSQSEETDSSPGLLFFQRPGTPEEQRCDTAGLPCRSGFWVLKGSRIQPPAPGTPSPLPYSPAAGGTPAVSGGYLMEDTLFSDPVTAALFVSGGTCRDPSVWKNRSGKPLYRSAAEPAAGRASAPPRSPMPASRPVPSPEAPPPPRRSADQPVKSGTKHSGPSAPDGYVLLHLCSTDLSTFGYFHPDTQQFTVMKGSQMSETEVSSLRPDFSTRRRTLIAEGRVHAFVFVQDTVFPNPAVAASVLFGEEKDGWNSWAAEDGTVLGSLPLHVLQGSRTEPSTAEPVLFHLTETSVKAFGHMADGGFTVCRGSEIEPLEASDCPARYRARRRQLRDQGIVKNCYFTCDTTFSGAVVAAGCILGRSGASLSLWKDSRGRTLDYVLHTR